MEQTFNTAIVVHAAIATPYGHDVHVKVLDGEDCTHVIEIDRPAAAIAFIAAGAAYLEEYTKDEFAQGLSRAAKDAVLINALRDEITALTAEK